MFNNYQPKSKKNIKCERRILKTIVILTATLLGLYNSPYASTPTPNMEKSEDIAAPMNAMAHKFGIFGNIGYGRYVMEDVNNDLHTWNRYFNSLGLSSVAPVTGGINYNFGVTFGITDNLIFGCEYGNLMANTKETLTRTGLSGQFEGDWPASEFGALIKYVVPIKDMFLLGLGFEISYFSVTGFEKALLNDDYNADPVLNFRENFNGNTVGSKIFGSAEAFISHNFSLGLDVGYRYAKIDAVYINGSSQILKNPDGSNELFDYSGLYGQLGVRFYFSVQSDSNSKAKILTSYFPITGHETPESLNTFKNTPVIVKPNEEKATKKSLSDKLHELKSLADDGTITQEEYKVLKQKLLDGFVKDK